jgi:hypothetical protein
VTVGVAEEVGEESAQQAERSGEHGAPGQRQGGGGHERCGNEGITCAIDLHEREALRPK